MNANDKRLMRRLRDAINEHRNAAIEDSWKGGGDPEDIPLIEADLVRTRRKLHRTLREIENRLHGDKS